VKYNPSIRDVKRMERNHESQRKFEKKTRKSAVPSDRESCLVLVFVVFNLSPSLVNQSKMIRAVKYKTAVKHGINVVRH